jgi:hypothetical protein
MRAVVALSLVLLACSHAPQEGAADAGGATDATAATDGSADAAFASEVSPPEGGGAATDGPGIADSGKTPEGGPTTRSAGCGTAPPHSANYAATTTDGNGTTRSYAVMLPSPYDKDTALALTVAYHGAGGTVAQAEAFGIQSGTGASSSSFFLFPQGIDFQTYGVGWDDTCGGYDMPLFDHMLSDIEAHYCIDLSRVFVAGFSWGCDQVTALTCCRGDRIRAMSGASCTDEYSDASAYQTYDNLKCPDLGSTAIRFTHDASGGDSAYPKPLFTTTSQLFQFFSGCPPFTGTIPPDACHTYAGCADPFIECPYTNLGHATPSGWGTDTWSFFDSFQ